MVKRVYVEKKKDFAYEASELFNEISNFLQIENLKSLRVINRYDVSGIDDSLFEHAKQTVFSEPQVDNIYDDISKEVCDFTFAVELLPGQYDQRADAAAECIQIISQKAKPKVRTAKVYLFAGCFSQTDKDKIKDFLINPVEAKEADLGEYNDFSMTLNSPEKVEILEDFLNKSESDLKLFIEKQGLAMDISDLTFTQQYFQEEQRDPTITEIKVIDTYWSDHCRHTTFNTVIEDVAFEDKTVEATYQRYLETRKSLGRNKPISLMDIGTIAAKYLRTRDKLENLDESDEINACTVKIKVKVDGRVEDWLLLFKNETHNHPTEIEPFGGAATCIGGAIRDPLSGRAYVYSAMRITGAGDPLSDEKLTMEGKLSQRKIVTTAAKGYSSYGNQIGVATGQVDEIYHPGYIAKRMEVGAVVAAAPAENVVRAQPIAGDIVLLLGGKTGRDGCGGATGSSKSHTVDSLDNCGAEVQKGNAPEERKIQRLFRNPKASRMIKRCNDFGAGGVSVAIGELAEGLDIDLNAVPKKYEGLNGTELAISESQERMAVVISSDNMEEFNALAHEENLECTKVADVTNSNRLVIRWNGEKIVDLSRDFLNTNGTDKFANVLVREGHTYGKAIDGDFISNMNILVDDLNICSKRGLSEMFDSTIGAGTVVMPFGGQYQRTPNQSMVNLISMENANSDTASIMSWGYNPFISEKSPFDGAYLAVVESVAKLIASGSSLENTYLSFQEYFEKLRDEKERWGKPFASVLGAFKAQMDLGVAAIGGKDSMSGTFEDIDVPPTLISFAVTTEDAEKIVTPEFKQVNHNVIMLFPKIDENGLPSGESLKKVFEKVHELTSSGRAVAVYTPTMGGIAEAVYKMAIGNNIGFKYDSKIDLDRIFAYNYGSFILEIADTTHVEDSILLGHTISEPALIHGEQVVELSTLDDIYENKLESVYNFKPVAELGKTRNLDNLSIASVNEIKPHASYKVDRPKVLIPVFPGTNCEYDSAKPFRDSGADVELFIINNRSSEDITESVDLFAKKVRESHIIFIPGGFSSGDEPDGSGKFITAFFRNAKIKDAVEDLLDNREGLMAGICNGFQALIKLGLLPYGKIMDVDSSFPTLTLNEIARHQSKIVNIKVVSNMSPWMANNKVGQIFKAPISHGEGRFIGTDKVLKEMAANGQIMTQYVDMDGNPTYNVHYNPNGSYYAIEGITSPDGRILGKMGHSERIGKHLYKNVPGQYDLQMFKAAVDYFK